MLLSIRSERQRFPSRKGIEFIGSGGAVVGTVVPLQLVHP